MKYFFLTGLYRSGTTLTEKLISSHRNSFAASQPFPYLFFHAKKQFFNSRQIQRVIPLGNLFLENEYTVEEFAYFLSELFITKEEIEILVDSMQHYQGFWSPQILNELKGVGEKSMVDVFKDIVRISIEISGKEDVVCGGVKEILCEEFIPYFLHNKIKVIVVVRDPRDVITSLNYGQGEKFTGPVRPTLFNIRNWRKSIAYCIAFKDHPLFKFVRYEDLACYPDKTMKEVFSFLDLPSTTLDFSILKDQLNVNWPGNSSFFQSCRVETSGIGRYVQMLPENVTSFIESMCYPEMRFLDYKSYKVVTGKSFEECRSFIDPFNQARPDYDLLLEPLDKEFEKERMRLDHLKNEYIDAGSKKMWFIFEKVHEVLKKFV